MSKRYSYEIILVVVAIALQAVIVTLLYGTFSSIGTDGVIYALFAKSIATGHGLTIYGQAHTVFSPFLSIVIAPVFLLVRNLELAAISTTIALGVFTIPILYMLVRKMSSQRAAWIALVVVAIDANLIFSYLSPSPQTLVVFLCAILFFVLLYLIETHSFSWRKALLFFVAGVLTGLLYLTRPEYFFFIIPLLVFLALALPRVLTLRWRVCALAVVALGFVLTSLPYLIFLHQHSGQWTFTGRSSGVALYATGEIDQADTQGDNFIEPLTSTDAGNNQGILGALVHHPGSTLKRLFKGLRDSERNMTRTFGFLGMGLFVLGIRELILKRKYREIFLFILFLTPLAAIAIGQGGTANYLVQFSFLFVIGIAIGCDALARDTRIPATFLAIIVALYLFIPVPQNYLFTPPDSLRKEYKMLGMWMHNNYPAVVDRKILSRKPATAFYANGQFSDLPTHKSLTELVDYMRSQKIEYLVVDQRHISIESPQLVDLLDPSKSPKTLEFIHSEDYLSHGIYFYKLR